VSARILVVEDDALIADALRYALEREGFDVDVVYDGEAALERIAEREPDLVLLDVVLPGRYSGLDVCEELRRTSLAPVIVLTARGTELDCVLGLERGADDYVVKPFSMAELVARVRAQLRRRRLNDRQALLDVRRAGSLRLDVRRHEVEVAGRRVHLTPSEFKILALLSESPGRVYSRREIVSRLWSSEFVGDMRSCDPHVARLRRKLAAGGDDAPTLEAVRGEGYKLVADARPARVAEL
jgi:two-component system response regulator RegX3